MININHPNSDHQKNEYRLLLTAIKQFSTWKLQVTKVFSFSVRKLFQENIDFDVLKFRSKAVQSKLFQIIQIHSRLSVAEKFWELSMTICHVEHRKCVKRSKL